MKVDKGMISFVSERLGYGADLSVIAVHDTAGTGHSVSLGNAFVLEEILSQEAGNDGGTVNLYIMVQG